jgi:hypothetical protein
MLIWNGNTKKGLQTLRDFFQQLPPSAHNIQSIDCQPIAGARSLSLSLFASAHHLHLQASLILTTLARLHACSLVCTDGTDTPQASNIFVVVVGTVTYAKEDPRHFHQTFILAQEPGKGTYYIVNDCLRLTS